MTSTSSWEYLCYEEYTGPPKPNSDIGGKGVLIGFVGTAWLAVLIVVLHYIIAFDPEKSPFGDRDEDGWKPNRVDKLVMGPLLLLRQSKIFSNQQDWERTLKQAVLNMCDIQLLTGLGIMLSGYVNILQNSVSAYHWHMIAYLAWFSNLTHVSCLTLLRTDLHRSQAQRRWRLSFMFILWVTLLAAIGPTLWFNWPHTDALSTSASLNARCFFYPTIARNALRKAYCDNYVSGLRRNETREMLRNCLSSPDSYRLNSLGAEGLQSAVLSLVLTACTFFTRLFKIHQSWSAWGKVMVHERVGRWYLIHGRRVLAACHRNPGQNQRQSTLRRFYEKLTRLYMRAYISGFLAVKVLAEIISSELSDVYWLVVSASWGTLRLLEARSSVSVDDDGWGFGQILPIFLLVGPMVAFVTPIESFGRWQVGTVNYKEGPNSSSGAAQSLVLAVPADNTSSISHNQLLPRANTLPATVNTYDEILPMTRFQAEIRGQGVEMSSYAITAGSHTANDGVTTQARTTEPQNHPNISPLSVHTVHQLQEQPIRLEVYLNSHYTRSKWIRCVIAFTCLQVLLITIFVFIELGKQATAILTFTDYVVNIVFIQPLNVWFAIVLDLGLNRDHVFRRSIFWLPLVFWLLVTIDIVPLMIAWGWENDIFFEIRAVLSLSFVGWFIPNISSRCAAAIAQRA